MTGSPEPLVMNACTFYHIFLQDMIVILNRRDITEILLKVALKHDNTH